MALVAALSLTASLPEERSLSPGVKRPVVAPIALLHVGPHKTGTTTLQQVLTRLHPVLAKQTAFNHTANSGDFAQRTSWPSLCRAAPHRTTKDTTTRK